MADQATTLVGYDAPSSEATPALPRLPSPGTLVGSKYMLVRRIGEGGMAVVYEAYHVRLGQRLAIKVLKPDILDIDLVYARFEREARATAQLRSIHTARVIDVDTLPGGLPYIVLEYLEGRDLDAELQECGPMPVDEAVDIVLQVADAMAEAHAQGCVHRDLKPANLFVCRSAGRRVLKILDFGLSRNDRDDARITSAHGYFGTPAYASPEQMREAASADSRSDVWSLGIILFELLTGRPPFEGTAAQVIARVVCDPVPWPLDRRPNLPVALARVVMHALEREPARRIQSMRDFARELAPFGPRQSAAEAIADAHRGRGRLGEILIADGLLTSEGLEQALAEQRRSGALLGRVLLDLGIVSRPDLLTAIAKQQGIDSMSPPSSAVMRVKTREADTLRAPPRPECYEDEPVVLPGPRRTALAVIATVAGLAVAGAGVAALLLSR